MQMGENLIHHTLTRCNVAMQQQQPYAYGKNKKSGEAAFNPQKHQIIIIKKKKKRFSIEKKQNFTEWHIYMYIMITCHKFHKSLH